MSNQQNPIERLLADLQQSNYQKVKVAVTDIDGILRGKVIHFDKFMSIVKKNFGFCSVVFGWDSADACYDTSTYTGWHTGYPDALVRIVPESYRRIPWDKQMPFFLGEFIDDANQPLAVCPRQVLKRILAKAEKMGFAALVGCEFEWFNFRESPASLRDKGYKNPEPLTPGMYGYSLLRANLYNDYFNTLFDDCAAFNIPIEGLHTESGPGVYEAAIQACPALEAADRAVLFKTAVKQLANNAQIVASFMAKWHPDLPGCSGHIHQSLSDGSKNVFYDPQHPYGMSTIFQQYLAGVIRYTPEFLAMMAPTINSYKRFVKGYWAPTHSTWGVDNRTCAYRVISGGGSSTRLEMRAPGADMNPYLAMAASLGAGLLGIEQGLPLTAPPVRGNAYDQQEAPAFAQNLAEASTVLRQSSAACELFGENFVQHFCQTRNWEWQQWRKSVTDWEIKRYFEII